MIRPDDLFTHAMSLMRSPDEVDTRRAVSAAYYALFDSIANDGAAVFGSAGPETVGQVVRAFEHGTMSKVCRTYLQQPLRGNTDPRLINVAQAFVDLQDARVAADYDLRSTIAQIDAARLIGSLAGVLTVWPDVARSSQGRVFLAKLLLGPRLNRRG